MSSSKQAKLSHHHEAPPPSSSSQPTAASSSSSSLPALPTSHFPSSADPSISNEEEDETSQTPLHSTSSRRSHGSSSLHHHHTSSPPSHPSPPSPPPSNSQPDNDAQDIDSLDESDEGSDSYGSEDDYAWIPWFCALKGNEFFSEVEEEFAQDAFNLTGLEQLVPYFDQALDMILDVELTDVMSEETQEVIENDAENLFGLIHARYIITSRGLQAMLDKYRLFHFGRCPRVLCRGQAVLPIGLSDTPNEDSVKLYCFSMDTRLLTDQGFLFLHQIVAALLDVDAQAGLVESHVGDRWLTEQSGLRFDRLRFACYDPATRSIVYRPASALLIRPRGPHRMVEFTEAAAPARWSAASADSCGRLLVRQGRGDDDDGSEATAGSSNVSLLVTEDHDMYAQRGMAFTQRKIGWEVKEETREERRARLDAGLKADDPSRRVGFAKYKASALADQQGGFNVVRLLHHAESGVRRASGRLSFAAALGLRHEEDDALFLELYGFWIGAGSLQYSSARTCIGIVFTQRKEEDINFLDRLVQALGLQRRTEYEWWAETSTQQLPLVIRRPSWLSFFDAAHRVHYVSSSLYVAQQALTVGDEIAVNDEEFSQSSDDRSSTAVSVESHDAAEAAVPLPVKSAKAMQAWVLEELSAGQAWQVILGYWRADGSWNPDKKGYRHRCLYTSSVVLRDQLVRLLLHAGCSPHFRLMYASGTIRGCVDRAAYDKWRATPLQRRRPEDKPEMQSAAFASSLAESDKASWYIYRAPADAWVVSFFQSLTPNLRLSADEIKRDDTYNDMVWCVSVPPTGLIIAQRAFTDGRGVVSQASRPTIVGNCPRCEEIYATKSPRHEHIDGAYFGTTFAHLFFLTFPELKVSKSKEFYVPRVFGFRIHKSAYKKSLEMRKKEKEKEKERRKKDQQSQGQLQGIAGGQAAGGGGGGQVPMLMSGSAGGGTAGGGTAQS